MALDAALRDAELRRDADRAALDEQARIEAEETDARTQLEQPAPVYAPVSGCTRRCGRRGGCARCAGS